MTKSCARDPDKLVSMRASAALLRGMIGLPKWLVASLAMLAVVLASSEAWSQGIFLTQLSDNALDRFNEACPGLYTAPGTECHKKICGVSVDISQGPGRTISFNGSAPRAAHTTDADAIANANVLNTACGGAGTADSLLVSGGAYGLQTYVVETFDTTAGHALPDKSKASLRIGGRFEHGSGDNLAASTNGAIVPFTYSRWLSDKSFLNVAGNVMYAHLNATSATVPNPTGGPPTVALPAWNQEGITIAPSYGRMLKEDEATGKKAAVGAWIPLQFYTMAMPGLDKRLNHYALGVGGIATGSIQLSATRLSGGTSLAPKVADGAIVMPLNLMARLERSISPFVEGFATASLAVDPVGKGPAFFIGGFGANVGSFDFGYRIFAGGGFVAHMLGFSFKTELAGNEALAKPDGQTEPEKPAESETKKPAESETKKPAEAEPKKP
ncbi:MAG: hypothetical protein HY898_11820 [Deltaproteobacteria bacterium]|nr:hypothetical protein [Deltaproteobacteria bacterium]